MAKSEKNKTAESTLQQLRRQKFRKLFDSAERLIGLRLCFHDHTVGHRSGLPLSLRLMAHPACLRLRREDSRNDELCSEFDYIRTHRELVALPQGRVQTCPHGMSNIAVPVFCTGRLVGVLFAGPCWHSDKPCPYGEMPAAPDSRWLEDRLAVLGAVALQMGALLEQEGDYRPPDRQQQVNSYIQDHLDAAASLTGLARELGLSPSRTSHVVRQIFGIPFSALLQQQRMQQASQLLVTSELPISEVSLLCGIVDPNYFSRVFKKQFNRSPVEYRRRHALLLKKRN